VPRKLLFPSLAAAVMVAINAMPVLQERPSIAQM
jgi:hypothetical protein